MSSSDHVCRPADRNSERPEPKAMGAGAFHDATNLAGQVASALPYLRRHARALTGSQTSGDRYAAATLEALLQDRALLDGQPAGPRVALFRLFYSIWQSSGATLEPEDEPADGPRGRALGHLARLTPNSREALLLHSVEGFDEEDIAAIMGQSPQSVAQLIDRARLDMHDLVRGNVLIIEDEAMIALDLEAIVTGLGHRVTGIARTRDEAVRHGRDSPPDLVLADIRLADQSSGIDAVRALLAAFPDMPVIFVTGFPEHLLTGERPEPAFLIAKPFTSDQVASAVSQAMFFASTETLRG
jgi:DNA-directed RNA polymerase specialized sigma24 family protein/CheY-like chemotaxis protein